MLFRRFENLIDVFKPSPDVAPPAGMLRFYAHYLKLFHKLDPWVESLNKK